MMEVEESLRKETLVNEEQQAYIRVLKETLEQKLMHYGIMFGRPQASSSHYSTPNDHQSTVDGFL